MNPTTMTENHQDYQWYGYKYGIFGLIARASLRSLQFIFAVIVAVLYGIDLAHATKVNRHAQASWIYAEIVSGLSAITCIVHLSVKVKRVAWCTWDFVLVVLWVAQTGVFGTLYGPNATPDSGSTLSLDRMRASVWIDLVNMVLWLATTVLAIGWCISTRRVTRRMDQDDHSDNGYKRMSYRRGIDEEDRDSSYECGIVDIKQDTGMCNREDEGLKEEKKASVFGRN